jgi:hypothetical protein
MTDKIRLRVWLAGVGPIVVVGALAAYWLMPRDKPPVRRTLATTSEALEPSPTAAAVVAIPPPAVTTGPSAPPRVAAPFPPAAGVPVASPSGFGPPPEPIPELEAIYREPPHNDHWTEDEKTAYKQKRLDDLGAGERRLAREIAAARQSGDTATEQRKAAALTYLQQQHAMIEQMLRAHRDGGP